MTSTASARHCRADAAHPSTAAPPREPDVEVTCHRRLRGPYTGGGTLLRRIVPELLASDPEPVLARATNLVAVCPELAALLPLPEKTLTEAAGPYERTRFYAATRTERLVHGVTELLLVWARTCHPEGAVVAFTDVEHADNTDRELIRVMLRRCDPAVLTVVVEAGEQVDDPRLADALDTYTSRAARRERPRPAPEPGCDAAQWYIDRDCVDEDPAALRAYAELSPQERASRHTARAEALAALGEPSLHYGAIAYHREHGTDPAGVGAEAMLFATTRCLELGYYHASMDLALRGRRMVTAQTNPSVYWNLTTKVAACLSYLGPAEEAARYLGELRTSLSAEMHMRSAYMTAMLYTRYLPKGDQDHETALEWSNVSIVIADNYPKPERRAFNGAFMRNGRALVEMHRGRLQDALDLVNEAIGMTDTHLGDEEQLLHRSVLRHNRAQVLSAMGDPAAIADFDAVIRQDPNYGEYYFDRATARRNAGLYAEALEDYATAIRLNPPFHEAHYNRADLLRELGDEEGALRDLDYALELEPDHLDSLINRADLLLSMGRGPDARADVEHGLKLDPGNARLLAARGALLAEAGEDEAAGEAYGAALEADRTLVAAWANRAVLAYGNGRVEQAVADLTEAIGLTDEPSLRANRALAYQDLGRHREALGDLDAALAAGAEDPDLLYRRGMSRHALGDTAAARADWLEHLARCGDSGSPYRERIDALNGAPLSAQSPQSVA